VGLELAELLACFGFGDSFSYSGGGAKKKSHFFVEQKPTVWSVLVLCSDGGG
jgi:hypothetical protein